MRILKLFSSTIQNFQLDEIAYRKLPQNIADRNGVNSKKKNAPQTEL